MARRVDRAVFALLLFLLAAAAVLAGRANLLADSVDYYVNLQRLSPAGGPPIVDNAHFAAQKSPGYPLAALPVHLVLLWLVDPLVGTTVVEPPESEMEGPPGLIPPQPLLLREAAFHDYPVAAGPARYQWKIALALALTSYGFLFAGLLAIAATLRRAFPDAPGYSLAALLLAGSPILLSNVVAMPLYATMTAFGAAALFAERFTCALAERRPKHCAAAGAWLGLVVLVRLEAAVFAAALFALLLAYRERRVLGWMAAGAAWAAPAWAAYNLRLFGTPFAFEILRGDINRLRIDPGYIVRCVADPSSGLLFWSPAVCLGLAGLFFARDRWLRRLAIAALPMVAVWLVRVPLMAMPDAPPEIAGVPVMPPGGGMDAAELIRGDINRYATVLAPFAALGLREMAAWVRRRTGASAA